MSERERFNREVAEAKADIREAIREQSKEKFLETQAKLEKLLGEKVATRIIAEIRLDLPNF